MSPAEKRISDWVIERKELLFFACITILEILIRLAGRDFISGDMTYCLLPWYEQSKNGGGFTALKEQIGNYNLLYQTIIAAMTYIPIKPLYLIKASSALFDFLLALLSAQYVCEISGRKTDGTTFLLVYTCVLSMPTVILNSAYWGQCDAMYSFFMILCLYLLHKKKGIPAFLCLGVALALKLQAIFLLPFVVVYYFYSQSFSLLHSAAILPGFWMPGIIAYLNGRSLLAPFAIYLNQMGYYKKMMMNIHSVWVIIGDNYEALHKMAIFLTIIILGVGAFVYLQHKGKAADGKAHVVWAAWFIWTCILFLPEMHERYNFPLDILLIMLAFLDVKYIKYAVASGILSAITYNGYLFDGQGVSLAGSVVYLIVWFLFTLETFSLPKMAGRKDIENLST